MLYSNSTNGRLRCALAAAALGLGALGAANSAQAADEKTNDHLPDWAPQPPARVMEDRMRAELSLLAATFDTQLRLDPSIEIQGTRVSAEDDLALDDSKLLALAELTLLPGERHLVRLSGFSARRSARSVLTRGIVFEDDVYFSGELVDSELNLTMFGLTYGYRFIASERAEFTATFGIQVAEVEANAVVRSRMVREPETGVAPLPLVGVEGRYDVTPRWSVEARAQYLTADIDDVDGTILDARAAIAWRANPYLVLGAGYRLFSIDIDSENESTPGFVDLEIDGPMLFIRASL